VADLSVGTKTIHEVTWTADPNVNPIHAANAVADEVAQLLGERALSLSA